MIICNIDVTTEEGRNKFNKEHIGEFKVYKTNDGYITLEGLGEEQRPIYFDSDTNMFDTKG